jgi:hypothetical protein
MIHVVVMKCLIGLPLLIHIELLWGSRGVGVLKIEQLESEFLYRLHSPGHSGKLSLMQMCVNAYVFVSVLLNRYNVTVIAPINNILLSTPICVCDSWSPETKLLPWCAWQLETLRNTELRKGTSTSRFCYYCNGQVHTLRVLICSLSYL